MEAEFQDLLSESWRIRKVSGVIQSQSKSLRTKATLGISPHLKIMGRVDSVSPGPSPKTREPGMLLSEGRRRWMSQLK